MQRLCKARRSGMPISRVVRERGVNCTGMRLRRAVVSAAGVVPRPGSSGWASVGLGRTGTGRGCGSGEVSRYAGVGARACAVGHLLTFFGVGLWSISLLVPLATCHAVSMLLTLAYSYFCGSNSKIGHVKHGTPSSRIQVWLMFDGHPLERARCNLVVATVGLL